MLFWLALLIIFVILLDKIARAILKNEEHQNKTPFYRCGCGKPANSFIDGTEIPICDKCEAEMKQYEK